MGYTIIDKVKIGSFAIGSAVINGATWFGIGTAAGAGTPIIATLVIIGMFGDLASTVHSSLKEIRKKNNKSMLHDQLLAEQKRQKPALRELKRQVEALKRQHEELLIKATHREQEATLVQSPAKKAKRHSTEVSLPQKRSEYARGIHRRLRTLLHLSDQLDHDLTYDPKNETQPKGVPFQATTASKKYVEGIVNLEITTEQASNQEASLASELPAKESVAHKKTLSLSKSSRERIETTQTSKLERVIPIAKGLFKGCLKGAAAAFGTIKICSTLAGANIPVVSMGMIVPVVAVGLISAVGNAFLTQKAHKEELEEENKSANILQHTLRLQGEREVISMILSQYTRPEKPTAKEEAKSLLSQPPADTALSMSLLPGSARSDEVDARLASPSKDELPATTFGRGSFFSQSPASTVQLPLGTSQLLPPV